LQLEKQDDDLDTQLDEIGEGVLDLVEIARLLGEEVQEQEAMLGTVQ
jgi:hypothetical protein